MILLFTAPNDDYRLYKRDLLNVCCEPNDAYMQFAYKYERVPENLRSGERLKKQTALVVLCEAVSKKPPFYTYHPIRIGKIVGKPKSEHESLNIIFSLQRFFDYKRYGQEPGIERFMELFQQYILRKGEHPGGAQPYRWIREDDELINGREPDADPWLPARSDFSDSTWMSLVHHLRTCEGLQDADFFSIQKPDAFGGSPAFLFSARRKYFLFPVKAKYKIGRATYKVSGGRSHRLVLSIPFVEKAKYPKPKLDINERVASVSGPFLRQRGSGIEADFEVVLKRSFQQETSMLELTLEGDPEQPNRVKAPEIQALIIVTVPWILLSFAVILLAIGGILAVISPASLDELSTVTGINGTGFGTWLKDHKLLAFTISKAIAFLSLALGTFLGFNKLPFKG